MALQPSTGGTFVVDIFHAPPTSATAAATNVQPRVLWDRKTDGGFPETKELKRRVRDVIEPGRDLGHVDRDHPRPSAQAPAPSDAAAPTTSASVSAPVPTPVAAAAAPPRGQEAEGGRPLPSRAELEAAGQAGGGGPGEAEAAARLLGVLAKAEGDKPCEDCA